MPASRCPYHPIPDVLAHLPGYPPTLEFMGKPHNTAQRQYAVWNAGKVLLCGGGNHSEIDVFHLVRLVNQIDANLSSPPS
jgi:hypothetical protein